VSGYEGEAADHIRAALKGLSSTTDNLGNVYVTLGSGAPHRLIATSIDQPGYVISDVTEDGYLRVQRVPQRAPNNVFDQLNFAQPLVIRTRSGQNVPGVFAGLSVHLQPGRQITPKMNHVEEMYVDIGAKTAADVANAGVNLLDPVTPLPVVSKLAEDWFAGEGTGDHFGAYALVDLLLGVAGEQKNLRGTLTVAFLAQSWTGGRGLDRILNELHPDELIFVGRLQPKPEKDTDRVSQPEKAPREGGVLLGVQAESDADLGEEFKRLAEEKQIGLSALSATLPRIGGYAKPSAFPARTVAIGVATRFPVTPIETVNQSDVSSLVHLLYWYALGKEQTHGVGGGSGWGCDHCGPPLVGKLTEAYGASGHEGAVRDEVKRLLPEWAQKKVTTDAAGNLVLHVGDGKKDAKTPRIAFVAHLDEIGYEVKKIEDDGRLQVEVLGGGYPQYFLGHVVLVHKKDGSDVGGVLELPEGWDKPGFEWPSGAKAMDEPTHVYVGTKSKEETEKLGIAAGDFVTIPKEYRPLLGTRANARSFDDRVGCAALITAVRALGPELPGRDVTFVWSTEEEVGLKGAAAFAEQAAKEGRVPDFVFAIDTFVSSDSPLESKRFADAKLGEGFVVRAVDNSNIVPREYVDRVVALAKENSIPVQYGVTGGGNDGAVFLRYGSVDVALGWPLRYAHSPAEVIDTKDLDALGKIVEVIARKW